jgi:hypothetical protein
MSENKTKLPTIAQLYEDNLEVAFKNDQFNQLLNLQPKADWIKENKYAGNSKYIPIGVVETLLQKLFKKVKIEVLREGVMFNAISVTVRVHYWDGISNEWNFHDGVGAAQLQTKQGSSPADLANINNNAVMMALPMAKSYAIKDACEHIGRLFGRDLNRKDYMEFESDKSMSVDNVNISKEIARISKHISESKTMQELEEVKDYCEKYDLLEMYYAKKEELKGK